MVHVSSNGGVKKDYYAIMDVAATAGMLMLEANAECYRVEDTMRYILATSDLAITEANATVKAITLMLDDDDPDFKPITVMRTIKDKDTDLNRIYKVNHISRQVYLQKITLEEAKEQLARVGTNDYSPITLTVMNILKIPAYVLILGGGVAEFLIGFAIGIFVEWFSGFRDRWGMNAFLYRLVITSIIAFTLTLALIEREEIKQAIIITATLIPLYPGVSFTNGIRDTLKGDYTSGTARIVDAFVTAFSLAIGVIMGLFLAGMVIA